LVRGRIRQRRVSDISLSIPHNDAVVAALFGETADIQQQMASQYFSIFELADSASSHGYALFLTLGKPSGFVSARDFQKALWWYSGAFEVGILPMPPVFSGGELWNSGFREAAALRSLFWGEPSPGRPQKIATGKVEMPSLFVCGSADPFAMCDRPSALATKDHVSTDYQDLVVQCGHSLLSCSEWSETQRVIDAVIHRLISTTPRMYP